MTSLPQTRPSVQSTLRVVPLNGEPVTLAEQIDSEARSYRDRGDSFGLFLARQLDRLAQLVSWTGAQTPEEHEDRMQAWDDLIRDQWFDRGYDAGIRAARSDMVMPTAFYE